MEALEAISHLPYIAAYKMRQPTRLSDHPTTKNGDDPHPPKRAGPSCTVRIPISRVLSSPPEGGELHHLSRPGIATGLYLPTRIAPERTDGPPAAASGNNTARYFNPRGLPTLRVTTQRRALLPHVFTLTLPRRERRFSFLWHFPYLPHSGGPGR
ncbi:hypothetical protein SAMN05444359_10372 [Neolewinella agarilytica]|uniref:Uncharacterized protein n=1 Tax=Neolewinella agarilytica TaxID=478744 RepID=A0A1H9BDB8_9BACT|nr:hypothetical protein SAMN05444359_10372 [Neolewinella agarilytica]